MFIFNIFKKDTYREQHKKQILKWYKLWKDWYDDVYCIYDEDDGPIPATPDELYPDDSKQTLEEFGYLSKYECETIKRMAHVDMLKVLGVKWWI